MKVWDREILVELLRMRNVPEESAKVAATLFEELTKPETEPSKWAKLATGSDESLNDFLRELIARSLALPFQMFLDRIPEEDRDRLRRKLFP
jgi:hypothetical protein